MHAGTESVEAERPKERQKRREERRRSETWTEKKNVDILIQF